MQTGIVQDHLNRTLRQNMRSKIIDTSYRWERDICRYFFVFHNCMRSRAWIRIAYLVVLLVQFNNLNHRTRMALFGIV